MARRGAKRKNRGYTPGHKPVNDPVEQKDLGTPELQAQRSRCVGEAYIRAWDGSQIHAEILRGNIDARYYDVARKFCSVVTKFQSALKMIGGPALPRAGGGNFIGEMLPVYARNDWDCDDFLSMRKQYDDLLSIMDHGERRMLRAIQWDHPLTDIPATVSALQKAGDFLGMLGRGR